MTKYFVKTAAFTLFLSLFFTSCVEKEKPGNETLPLPSELIVGEWNVNSFIRKGEDRMESKLSEFTLKFGSQTEGRGIVAGSRTEASDGNQLSLNGEYHFVSTDQIVLSSGIFGRELTMDLEFEGKDKMTMSSFIEDKGLLKVSATRLSD